MMEDSPMMDTSWWTNIGSVSMINQVRREEIVEDIYNDLSKITIIEGCDAVGKSTLVREIMDNAPKSLNVRLLRFPDDRGNVKIRSTLFNSDVTDHRLASVFLFLADFTHAYEQYIKPYLDDRSTIFIFDRFIPSTCVYQKLTAHWMNVLFSDHKFKDFVSCFEDARYVYLHPLDLDAHKKRLSKKMGEDTNKYDPTTDKEILDQINGYRLFIEGQDRLGLLGSRYITKVFV